LIEDFEDGTNDFSAMISFCIFMMKTSFLPDNYEQWEQNWIDYYAVIFDFERDIFKKNVPPSVFRKGVRTYRRFAPIPPHQTNINVSVRRL
jgi:hypothetical protein